MPECPRCHKTKQPRGRSVPLEDNDWCDWDCPEYTNDPKPGHLWPNEPVDAATSYHWCKPDSGLKMMADTDEEKDE